MSILSNVLKNGLGNFLRKVVRTFEQLLLVPFFITSWGAEYYGEWLTLTIVPTILSLSDFGFSTAAGNSFVLNYVSGKYQEAANINKTSILAISLIIIFSCIISLFVILGLNYYNVFDKSIIGKSDAIISVCVLIFARLTDFFTDLINSYFRAVRKASIGLNLFALKTALCLFFGFVILSLGYGVVEFAFSQFFVIIIFNIFLYFKGRKYVSFYDAKAKFDYNSLKEIIRKGFGYLLFPVWNSIYFQGTTFVVRVVVGAEGVAIFNTTRTLARSINQIFSIINLSVFPEIQFELGAGNINNAQKLFRISMLSIIILGILGSVFLMLFGMDFYKFWTKNQLNVPVFMWYMFILGIFFNSFWSTSTVIFRANNDPYKFAFIGLVTACFSLLISYYLGLRYGLNGIAFGAVSLDIILAIFLLPLSTSALNMSLADLFLNISFDIHQFAGKIKNKLSK